MLASGSSRLVVCDEKMILLLLFSDKRVCLLTDEVELSDFISIHAEDEAFFEFIGSFIIIEWEVT